MDLQTDLLRTFVAAADTGGYTAAASTVHRSQSAVSLQMKRLEEGIGRRLFKRHGHSMLLTPEGETLLLYARRILQLHDEALAAVVKPDLTGRVRLGAPEDYAELLLPKVLSRFADAYPLVLVDVFCESSSELLKTLDHGELDLMVCTNSEVPERGETIYYDQVVWITSKNHLVHEQEPVPLALYHEDCIFREWAIKSLDGIGRKYRVAYTSPGSAGILAAVKAGLAVAPVASSTVTGDVLILSPADGFPVLPAAAITLITAGKPPSQAVQTLATYVAESFRELATAGL